METNNYSGNLLVILIVCWLLLPVGVLAQEPDSLELVLKTEKLTPVRQMEILDDLSWGYLNSDFQKSSFYARQGIVLAEKEKNEVMTITFYRNLGVAYDMVSKYDSAAMYLDQALALAIQEKDETLEAIIYTALGNSYNRQSVYPKAVEYYMSALPLFEKQEDKARVLQLYGNIGGLYMALKNTDRALFYLLQAETMARESDNQTQIAHISTNLCNVYFDMKEYDKALEYAVRAYELFRQFGYQYDSAISASYLSMVYRTAFSDFKKAEQYANEGLQMAEAFGASNLVAWSLSELSGLYRDQHRYKESEATALKALEMDSTDISLNKNLYANILWANVKMGDSEKALMYFDKFGKMLQVSANREYQASLSEMEVKYATEKKEGRITALEKEKRLHIWLGIAGGTILLLMLAYFVVRQHLAVHKRNLAEQQVKQLEQEKQLIATQAVLDGEAAERTRLARDLHDGLGGLLSVVKLNLFDLKKGASLGGDGVASFDRAMGLLDESIGELRRVAHNMMPDSLMRYGLKVSLIDFCDSIPMAEMLWFGGDERLDPKLEMMIYRTIHELVNNALKHSGAERIIVQVVQESDRLSLTVQDNGCGFDLAAETAGAGLNNIRNRVESYNGYMDIRSASGKGTEINVEFRLLNK